MISSTLNSSFKSFKNFKQILTNYNLVRNYKNVGLIKNEKKFLKNFNKKKIFITIALLPPVVIETIKSENKKLNHEIESVNEVKVLEKKNIFTLKEFFKLIKPNFIYFLISILGSLAIAYLNIKIPINLGDITNVISKFLTTDFDKNEFISSIKIPALKLIWLYILQGLFTSITISSLSTLGENVASDLKINLFKSIIHQDVEFFDKKKTGEIVNVLTSDVQEFKSSFKIFLSQGLKSLTQTIGCAISLYVTSPKMSVFLCILVPSLVTLGSFLGMFLRDLSKQCQNQLSKCSAVANEIIFSIKTIKACAMEEKEIEKYEECVFKSSSLNKSLGLGIGIFQGLTNLALNGIVLSCMVFGSHLISNKEITPGDLMSFLVAAQTIQKSLASLSLMTGHYLKFTTTGNKIYDFLNLKPSIDYSSTEKLNPLTGNIVFSNVNFSYPLRKEQIIFDNFNLKLSPGKVLAIVGPSGAGKSTIAQLLERFYDVDSGSITIDNVNLKELDIKWLRSKKMGYINQEPTLFATSILENIRYSCPEATDEQVYEAAKFANADEFIRKFPDGYSTILGEKGVSVSVGQKQRIAIAREVLKNPSILILDEATSALDAQSEVLITEALEKLMKNRTVLIIAHRLSTIKNADVIAVIENGKLCELGNHEDLIKLKGLYWNLIKQQQKLK